MQKLKEVKEVQKSYYQQREDEVKIIIAEIKVKLNLTDEALAKKVGIPFNTFNKKKQHPGMFRADHIWQLEKLAGRRQGS